MVKKNGGSTKALEGGLTKALEGGSTKTQDSGSINTWEGGSKSALMVTQQRTWRVAPQTGVKMQDCKWLPRVHFIHGRAVKLFLPNNFKFCQSLE